MTTTEKVLLHSAGPALWPDRYDENTLSGIKNTVGNYFFSALYQGLPRPKGGEFFQRKWFEKNTIKLDSVPKDCDFARAWDKASSQGKGDWTVSVLMARSRDGRYFIVNVTRDRIAGFRRDEKILAVAEDDMRRWGSVRTHGDQDPGSAGKDDAAAFRRLLERFWVTTAPVSGDKETRARPFASAAEGGNVFMVDAHWNKPYLDVLESFPKGKHDDDVDASSSSYNILAQSNNVLEAGESPLASYRGRRAVAPALR